MTRLMLICLLFKNFSAGSNLGRQTVINKSCLIMNVKMILSQNLHADKAREEKSNIMKLAFFFSIL